MNAEQARTLAALVAMASPSVARCVSTQNTRDPRFWDVTVYWRASDVPPLVLGSAAQVERTMRQLTAGGPNQGGP